MDSGLAQLVVVGMVLFIGWRIFRGWRVNLRKWYVPVVIILTLLGASVAINWARDVYHTYPEHCEVVKKDRDTTKLPDVSGCSPLDKQ
jgi:hypothetical protein